MKAFHAFAIFVAGLILGAAGVPAPGHGLIGSAGAAPADALEARLRGVEDCLEIERLLMRYGAALDSRDFTAYSELFAAQGIWQGGLGTFQGPEAIKAGMLKAFGAPGAPPPTGTFHLLTNPIIEVHGDQATASSRWTFWRMVDGKPVVALAGRYDDTLTREHGHWKFQKRVAS